MTKDSIESVRKRFGEYLKNRRENVLKEKNLLVFSYNSKLDNSKLRKIERGEVDIRFNTIIEVAKTYKLTDKAILGFRFNVEE